MNMAQGITISLDEDTAAIIAKLAAHTGLSASDIISRLVDGYLAPLHEINAFLEAHPPAGAGSLHEQGANLIQSYGPESIMDGIARIAPQYETLAARFNREMNELTNPAPPPLQ
jgi:hypothetical protein